MLFFLSFLQPKYTVNIRVRLRTATHRTMLYSVPKELEKNLLESTAVSFRITSKTAIAQNDKYTL